MEKKIIINGVETDYTISTEGIVKNTKTGRILKGSTTKDGYNRTQIVVAGKNKCILTHRLVAEYFIDNPDNLLYVHHKNGIFTDNRVENLFWSNSVKDGPEQVNKPAVKDDKKILPKDACTWKELSFTKDYLVCKEGFLFNKKSGRVLKGNDRCGYKRVRIDGAYYSVHRLVYETFVGPIAENMVIDHIDGDKGNNNLENLRCISQSENMKNAYSKGHKGQHPVKQYDLARNYIKTYPSCTAAAQEMGCSYRAISAAADRGGTSCGYFWKKVE